MATRMQQRRGTASQWTSANPVLNAGEMGWESDTNKFKIGDGTNHWADLDYFADTNSTVNPAFGTSITFEGATADSYETTLQVTDPTADRTITLPNVTGTVITTGNLSDITDIGVFTSTITMEGSTANDFELTLSAGDPTADRTLTFPDATDTLVGRATTDTLTNKTLTTPVISSITNGAATLTLPTSTGTIALTTDIPSGVVTESGTQTLTNKTLTSPVITGAVFNDGSIVFEGATANDYETTLTVTDPTADRTITFPDATTTVVGTDTTQTLTNKTIDSPTITSTNGAAVIHGILLPTAHGISFEGATDNDFETILTVVDPTADRTITFPDATGTVALAANVAALSGATFTGAVSGTDLTLSGNLTVNGTTTNINSTNLVVEDKNIILADVETPTDVTADGGGITLKGTTDKTFNWVDSTDSWTSSEHINLASGKTLKYNGTDLVASQSGNSGKYLTTDGTSTSWGTVSGYSAPTLGSTSIASGATVTTITGLTLSGATLTGSLTAGGGTGTSGQVLSSTGSGVQWITAGAGADEILVLMGAL
jgi:hypothetical protein